MTTPLHVLIIDGYSRASRDALEEAGMTLAWALYVKMLGQEDFEFDKSGEIAVKEDPRSFSNRPVGQRMAVISAGVIMNVLFAGVLFVKTGGFSGNYRVVNVFIAGNNAVNVADNSAPKKEEKKVELKDIEEKLDEILE